MKTNLTAIENLFGDSAGTSKQLTNITGDMKRMSGIVSFSEPFTLKVSNIDGNFERVYCFNGNCWFRFRKDCK